MPFDTITSFNLMSTTKKSWEVGVESSELWFVRVFHTVSFLPLPLCTIFLARSISSSSLPSHCTHTLSLCINNASLTRTQNSWWCHSGAMWQSWLWPLPAKHAGTRRKPQKSFASWCNYFSSNFRSYYNCTVRGTQLNCWVPFKNYKCVSMCRNVY